MTYQMQAQQPHQQSKSKPKSHHPLPAELGSEQSQDDRMQGDSEDVSSLEHERRALRKRYRDLINDTEERREELVHSSTEFLRERISKADTLYNQVTLTNEAALDAKLLAINAAMSAQQIRNTRFDNSFIDMNDFISKVRRFIGAERAEQAESDFDWHPLTDLAKVHMKSAPSITFLLGPLGVDLKQRKSAAQRVKSQPINRDTEEERKPDELKVEDIKKEENETTRNIQAIHKVLEEIGPLPYWKFVINPHSFSQTVENIFYCAFLAKEGRVQIDQLEEEYDDADESLAVKYPDCSIIACQQLPEEERVQLPKRQYMVNLDMGSWKSLIQKYDIRQCAIPTRSASVHSKSGLPEQGKWY